MEVAVDEGGLLVVKFRVLGQCEVIDDERRVELGSPKQRSLLALLLINHGSVVSTDRIIDELWGEGAGAKRSLQFLLCRL